jgi:hypothetical protein
LTCIVSPSERLFQAFNTDEALLSLVSAVVEVVQGSHKTCIHWSLVKSEASMNSWLSVVPTAGMPFELLVKIVIAFSVSLLGTTATIVDVVDGALFSLLGADPNS